MCILSLELRLVFSNATSLYSSCATSASMTGSADVRKDIDKDIKRTKLLQFCIKEKLDGNICLGIEICCLSNTSMATL